MRYSAKKTCSRGRTTQSTIGFCSPFVSCTIQTAPGAVYGPVPFFKNIPMLLLPSHFHLNLTNFTKAKNAVFGAVWCSLRYRHRALPRSADWESAVSQAGSLQVKQGSLSTVLRQRYAPLLSTRGASQAKASSPGRRFCHLTTFRLCIMGKKVWCCSYERDLNRAATVRQRAPATCRKGESQ